MATTSAETGPSTMSQISLVTSAILPPDFRISDGLVVTPSSRPRSLSSRISLTSAVSTKNFMAVSLAIFVRLARRIRRSAFALDQSRGKVTRHERQIRPPSASRAGAGADAGRAALHLCRARRHAVEPGSIVRVPLGPREVAGIVWDGDGERVDPKKLRPISAGLRLPADRPARCAASSTGSPPTRCRRPAWWRACCCARRRPSIRSPGPRACSAPSAEPDRMTAARARVLETCRRRACLDALRAWRMPPACRRPSSTG